MKAILILTFIAVIVAVCSSSDGPKSRQLPFPPVVPQLPHYISNSYLYPNLDPNHPGMRQIFRPRPSNPPSTVTVTHNITVTATVGCTVSTTACGSRRRHIIADLVNEQFEVQPSPINKIEPTASVVEVDSKRGGREANPQLYLAGYRPPHHGFYGPHSSPYLGQLLEPSQNEQVDEYNPYTRQINPLAVVSNILGGLAGGLANLIQSGPTNAFNSVTSMLPSGLNFVRPPAASAAANVTVTVTNCVVSISTSTSTPACSTKSPLLQCPELPL